MNDTPLRGEIWQVNLNPTVGAEMQKSRPSVVVSSDAVGRLPIKLVAPITEWNPRYSRNIWHVQIPADATTGLNKLSAVDVLQLRGVDTQRLIRRLGRLTAEQMEEIAAAIAAVVEYQ